MKKIFFEILLAIWIFVSLYAFVVLEFSSNPGLIIITPKVPAKITQIITRSRQIIWPFVYKDYIYDK